MSERVPSNVDLIVSATEAEAAAACAGFLGDELSKALERPGSIMFAISGGNSPKAVFAILARRKLDWARIHIFWVDERCVPTHDPASNYRMARETLIEPAGIPEANVHRVLTELDPEEAALAYAAEIEEVCGDDVEQRFDVMHRGIGPDGHTASLFPGDTLVLRSDGIAVATFVPKFEQWRVTLTPASLKQARVTVIYAPGTDKAEAVERIFEGPYDPLRTPAQIATRGGVRETWFLDPGSAARLTPDS